jgi:hypothetical protein
MGLFNTLKEKIFGHPEAKVAAPVPMAATAAAAATTAPAAKAVDVEATLAYLAEKSGHPSNWRESIVDLMKLVDMDSSLAARKELAQDMGYTGDMADSATMNIWLHKQVMAKLAHAKA